MSNLSYSQAMTSLSNFYKAGQDIILMMQELEGIEAINPNAPNLNERKKRAKNISTAILDALELEQQNRLLVEQNQLLTSKVSKLQNDLLEAYKQISIFKQIDQI